MTSAELIIEWAYVAAVLCLVLVHIAPPIKRLCDLIRADN